MLKRFLAGLLCLLTLVSQAPAQGLGRGCAGLGCGPGFNIGSGLSHSQGLGGGVSSGPVYLADFLTASNTGVLPSGVSVSSPSLGGLVGDASGKLTYKPNNLLTWSNTFSNAAWTTAQATLASGVTDPFGGASAWTLTEDTTNNAHIVYRTQVATSNSVISVYVKDAGAGYAFIGTTLGTGIQLVVNLTTGAINTIGSTSLRGAPTATSVGNGWWQVSFGATSAIAYIEIGTARAGSFSFTGTGAAIQIYQAVQAAVTYETTPRPGDQVITTSSAYYGPAWDRDSSGNALGLRVWESRTNLAKSSGAIGDANWSLFTAPTIALNATAAPDGTNTATSVTFPATAASIYQTISLAAGTYTLSVWAKSATATPFRFDIYANNDDVGPDLIPTGQWVRYSSTITIPQAGTTVQLRTASTQTAGQVYFWGFQLEAASVAGTYIPTSSAAVTAAADVVVSTSLAAVGGFDPSKGALLAEWGGLPTSDSANMIVGYNTSGSANSVYFDKANNGDTTAGGYINFVVANGATSILPLAAAGDDGGVHRAVATWNSSTISASIDGGAIASGANRNPAPSKMYLGSRDGSLYLNGYLRKVATYNTTLTSAQVTSRSKVGASFSASANDNIPDWLRHSFAANDNTLLRAAVGG